MHFRLIKKREIAELMKGNLLSLYVMKILRTSS